MNHLFCFSFFLLKCGVVGIFFLVFSFADSFSSADFSDSQKNISLDAVVKNILRADTIKKKFKLKKEIVTSHFVVAGESLFVESFFDGVLLALPLKLGYNYLSQKDIGKALSAQKKNWKERWEMLGEGVVVYYLPQHAAQKNIVRPVVASKKIHQNIEKKVFQEYRFFSLKNKKNPIAAEALTGYVGQEIVVAKSVGAILVERVAKLVQVKKDVGVFLRYHQRAASTKKQKRTRSKTPEKSLLAWNDLRF